MRARGVVLTELLVALGIIALVVASGYAQYRATEGARAKAAAEQVAALLRRVGQTAWAERTPYRVQFTPGAAAVRVERWTGSAWVEARGAVVPDWLAASGLLPAGTSVAWTTFPGHAFVAHPYTLGGVGQVSASTTAGQVALRGPGGAQLVVETNAAGEARVR